MFRWSLSVLVVVALLSAPALTSGLTGGPAPGAATERWFTLDAMAYACTERASGICLGYNGVTPGPTLQVNLGDWVHVTLVNRIAETVAPLAGDPETKARFAASAVGFHVHGTALAADQDGIGAHPGTQFADSTAHPNGNRTYTFRAAYPGAWHFHDHVIGVDGGEGSASGLFGSLVVRSGGETRPDHVFDLHFDTAGANGGRGLAANVAVGERFELLVVGLGEYLWKVTLTNPQGLVVGTVDLGPGISDRITVGNAMPGNYTWRAVGPLAVETGAVVVS